jgi:predicted AlkP superfamily pyrophosphatase or phosphodiesterase
MKFFILASSLFFLNLSSKAATSYSGYRAKPKLIVLLVIDQFRADFLTRMGSKYLPAGTEKAPGGFQFLASKSAYFPNTEIKVLSAVTCPGHAMISTGGYPSAIGIPLNEWYERSSKKVVKCIDGERDLISPSRLKTSTFGDEMKILNPKSQVLSVALKDRSAVMLGGHHADYVFWLGKKGWETSAFYSNSIPNWVPSVNQMFDKKILDSNGKLDEKSIEVLPISVELTADLALQALQKLDLGKDSSPDLLAVSFSTHDIAGHRYGPYSPEVDAVSLQIDKEISRLLKAIVNQVGSLQDVVVVLTGDHGIPPTATQAKAARIKSGKINSLEFFQRVANRLNSQFGKPKSEWIKATLTFNYYINEEALQETKANRSEVETVIKEEALKIEGVYDALTASEFKAGLRLHPRNLEQASNQFRFDTGGDIVVIPEPFFVGKDEVAATHVTGYSYDRYVPLFIMGRSVKGGVYADDAEIVDIAPTLSFILGQLPPAKSSGRVLKEIF